MRTSFKRYIVESMPLLSRPLDTPHSHYEKHWVFIVPATFLESRYERRRDGYLGVALDIAKPAEMVLTRPLHAYQKGRTWIAAGNSSKTEARKVEPSSAKPGTGYIKSRVY